MTLDKLYPKHKGSEKFGTCFRLVGKEKVKFGDYHELVCLVCNKIVKARPEKIFIGQKPCACSKQFYRTPERKKEKILEVSENKNIFPVKNEAILNGTQKFEVECGKCFHRWFVTFPYFVHRDSGCPCCAKQKRYTDEEYISRVNGIGQSKKFAFNSKVNDEKLTHKSKVSLRCKVCDNTWEVFLSNTLSGKYSCPSCSHTGFNPSRESVLYILKIEEDQKLLSYKYGITNNIVSRINNLKLKSQKLSIKVICSWGYQDGFLCRKHESNLKKLFPTYLTKEDMEDGYTETFPPDMLKDVFETQNLQYGGVQPGGARTDKFGG